MTVKVDIVGRLATTGFFDALDPDQLETLAGHCVIEQPVRGTTIFQEGDVADGLRLVVSGLLRVWLSEPSGREITLSLVEPGDLLGEIALLDGAPRSATASAVEASTVIFLRRVPFQNMLDCNPMFQRHMIELLCARLRGVTTHLSAATLLSLRSRLARLLHELAQSYAVPEGNGARFRRRFSQSDIANMLGVTREAVNKQLAAMMNDGLVNTNDGVFFIPDLMALLEV